MTRRLAVTLAYAIAAAFLASPSGAQDTPKPDTTKTPEAAKPAEPPRSDRHPPGAMLPDRHPPGAMLRVQVVISRHQGERKLASLPYSFSVTVEGRPVRVRMGVETPVAVATSSDTGKASTSFQYRNVGTNIDCNARDAGEGRYRLTLSVENSSVAGAGSGGLPEVTTTGAPLFRTFKTDLDPVLRDGQTVQTVASTDPVTGEVVKIDVTLNVVK